MATRLPLTQADESPPPLEQILQLAAQRGWRLFPAVPRGKKPLISSWPRLASCDPQTLTRWSEEHEGCNWAMACGPQSGVFVLDVDGEAGRRSLAALEKKHRPLPVTLTSITGGGGEHRFFQYPAGRDVRNSAGRLGTGLDFRGEGGYAMVPPSIHPLGPSYYWVNATIPVAAASNWLFEELLAGNNRNGRRTAQERSILREGERNDGLTRYAGALRRRGAEYPEIEKKLLEANQRRCQPTLPEREVINIAASVARYPAGGPDPLEVAWRAAQNNKSSPEEKFLELCRCLQGARPSQEITLPLKRIAGLMDVNWGTVSRYRSAAVQRGILTPAGQYVAHKVAGRYVYNEATRGQDGPQERDRLPAADGPANGPPLQTRATLVTSGLVCTPHHPSLHNSGASPSLRGSPSLHSDVSPSTNGGVAPGERVPDDEETRIAVARERGERLGFRDVFLHAFIERGLKLMEKWASAAQTQANRHDVKPGDYLPWGGRFRR